MKPRTLGTVLVLVLFLAGTPVGQALPVTPEPSASPMAEVTPVEPVGLTYAADKDIHGASLGEWNAGYWQWVTSLPVGVNPAQDPTGTLCGYGQHGPVFFVPRNMPSCTVPSGMAIFLPVAGSACSTVEPPPFHGEHEEQLRACAAAHADRYIGLVVRVNGVIVPDIERYRTQSPVFTLQLPEDNILAVPSGSGRAVADGYQIILTPLPPGTHEIVVHVEVTEGYALPDKVLHLTVIHPHGEA